jgi:predicted transcriptional regulator
MVTMTKLEKLTQAATALSDDQLDGVLSYVQSLSSEPFYNSAPPEALASIERGLADARAGRVIDGEEAFKASAARIAAAHR